MLLTALLSVLSNPYLLTVATVAFLVGFIAHSAVVVACVKIHRGRASTAAWPPAGSRNSRPFVPRLVGDQDGR